jgi:hypothetical protein
MPNPCEKESKKYEETKEKYEEAYNEYSDFLDEEEELRDDIELTKLAENRKLFAVGMMSLVAGAFSGIEEARDTGSTKAGAFFSFAATATSTAASATDYFDYEKDLELARRNQERLDRRKNRSMGRMERAEKDFLDSEKDLYHCEHGQSKEEQYDEYGNPADEDDIDTSYGKPDIDDENPSEDEIAECPVCGYQAKFEDFFDDNDVVICPNCQTDLVKYFDEGVSIDTYSGVEDSEGSYYEQ